MILINLCLRDGLRLLNKILNFVGSDTYDPLSGDATKKGKNYDRLRI